MTDAEGLAVEPDDLRAADGRVPGRRGLATRRRLLDATASMLPTTSYRELRVVDIARAAGTSPATFYQYFADVEAAVLVLAAELADAGAGQLRELLEADIWRDDPPSAARALAAGYLAFWTRHRALIRVIDLAALEGDGRFRDLRTWLLSGATNAFVERVASAKRAGAVAVDVDERAVAAVLTSALSHVAAHHDGIVEWGASESSLCETLAELVLWALGAHHQQGRRVESGAPDE